MSTYLVSDIHGDAVNFKKLLNIAGFQPDSDKIYIDGDIIDRGNKSLELLLYIIDLKGKYPENVWVVKGNHELFLQYYVEGKLDENTWAAFGGADTIKDYNQLNRNIKKQIYEFIKALPLYYRINHPDQGTAIVTHSGLVTDAIVRNKQGKIDVERSIKKGLELDEYKFLISSDIHIMPTVQLSEYMIVGHVPTIFLDDESYEILRKKNLLCIDSGSGYRKQGGKLSLYKLDDDSVMYI